MYLKLVLLGTISCLLFSTAYGDETPTRLKIISDDVNKTYILDGKVIKVTPIEGGKRAVAAARAVPDLKGSRQNPVDIDAKKVGNLEDLKNIQRQYLDKHYPGYTWAGPSTTKDQDRFLEMVVFRTKDGAAESVFFDVTECFKKIKRKDKGLKKEIEAREKSAIREEKLIKEGEKAVEESKGKEPKDIVVKGSE